MVHFLDPFDAGNRDPHWAVCIHVVSDIVLSVEEENADYLERRKSLPRIPYEDRDKSICNYSVMACDAEEAKYRALSRHFDDKAEKAQSLFYKMNPGYTRGIPKNLGDPYAD